VNGNVIVLPGGEVSPGSSPGIVSTARGDVVLLGGAIYVADVNGTLAGAQYDQINVQGTVTVSGAILALAGGSFRPSDGTVFTLLLNDDAGGIADPVVGQFVGLAEGATLRFGGIEATISYVGGTGNDITLTVTDRLRLVRTISPDAVVVVNDGTGGGGAASFTRKTESAPVIFLEATRPVANAQAADVRPQSLESRAVERLRVFLKVVDEVTGDEEGSAVELDPRVIDDVLGFFQRVRFPNGKYRIYLHEAGRAPRLIIEIAIRDGQAVSPENIPAPAESPPPVEQPEAPPSNRPADNPAGAVGDAGETTPANVSEGGLPTDDSAGIELPAAPRESELPSPSRHRWSYASRALAASLAVTTAVPTASGLTRRPLADSSRIPRTRFRTRFYPPPLPPS
jgi:hypothetical protein